MVSERIDNISMLTIEMAKPMQLTKVNPVPFSSFLTDEATNFENWGESMVTPMPQIHQMMRNNNGVSENVKGEIRQHVPETNNA